MRKTINSLLYDTASSSLIIDSESMTVLSVRLLKISLQTMSKAKSSQTQDLKAQTIIIMLRVAITC